MSKNLAFLLKGTAGFCVIISAAVLVSVGLIGNKGFVNNLKDHKLCPDPRVPDWVCALVIGTVAGILAGGVLGMKIR